MKNAVPDIEEKESSRQLWREVFSEDSDAFLDFYYQWVMGNNTVFDIYRDGRMVSMLHLNPYDVCLGKNIVQSNYIVAVATRSEYRRQGMMKKLLTDALKEMALQGLAFTFLMPADEAIYRPFGFSFIYRQNIAVMDAEERERSACCFGSLSISEVLPGEEVLLAECTQKWLECTYGCYVCRTPFYYKRLREEMACEGGKLMMVRENGRPAAFFSFWPADSGVIEVREFICRPFYAEDKMAGKMLLNAVQNFLIRETEGEPKDALRLRIRGCMVEGTETEPRIMARIINLPELIKAVSGSREITVLLNVCDSLLEENDGMFVWKSDENGSGLRRLQEGEEISVGHGADVYAETSIEGFASWFFRYAALEELQKQNVFYIEGKKEVLQQLKLPAPVFLNELV